MPSCPFGLEGHKTHVQGQNQANHKENYLQESSMTWECGSPGGKGCWGPYIQSTSLACPLRH